MLRSEQVKGEVKWGHAFFFNLISFYLGGGLGSGKKIIKIVVKKPVKYKP